MTTTREAMLSPVSAGVSAAPIRGSLGLPANGARVNVGLLGGPVTNVAGELVDVALNRATATVLTLTLEESGRRIVIPWRAIATVTTVPTASTAHPAL